MKIENRVVRHDYFIEDTIECGIELRGNEVKSIRAGMCNLRQSYCSVDSGGIVVHGMHITAYEKSNAFDVDVTRDRRLLLHKHEILKLRQKVQEQGITLIPVELYFNKKGKVKLLLGVCRGKKLYDKRAALRLKDLQREIERSNT